MYTSTRSLVHLNKSSSHDRQVAPVPGHHLLLDLGPGPAPALGRRRFGSLEATLVPGDEGLRAERERGALAPGGPQAGPCGPGVVDGGVQAHPDTVVGGGDVLAGTPEVDPGGVDGQGEVDGSPPRRGQVQGGDVFQQGLEVLGAATQTLLRSQSSAEL